MVASLVPRHRVKAPLVAWWPAGVKATEWMVTCLVPRHRAKAPLVAFRGEGEGVGGGLSRAPPQSFKGLGFLQE